MAEQVWQWLCNSGTYITASAILFFTAKGLLWLALPGLVVRQLRRKT